MRMTLIEGVGDEVTLFFVLALLAAVAVVAWWTTRVAERPLRIQTIIVGQRIIQVSGEDAPDAPAAEPEDGAAPAAPDEQRDEARTPEEELTCEEDEEDDVEVAVAEDLAVVEDDGRGEEGRERAGEREEEGAIRADGAAAEGAGEQGSQSPPAEGAPPGPPEDATDSATERTGPAPDAHQQLRQRRLAHLARQQRDSNPQPADSAPQASQPTTHPRLPTEAADSQPAAAAGQPAEETAQASSGEVFMVRLKFLNDTQRLVEGSRAEALADFKRRHFPTETAANRIVRLIFNGRILADQQTLAQCGLYHNCVVHCHVSAQPARAGAEPPPAGRAAAEQQLDIGVLLYPVLTSIVTLVWGLRLRYPELFSGTAVVVLAALTLLLAGVTAATFLPLERLAGAPPQRQQQLGR